MTNFHLTQRVVSSWLYMANNHQNGCIHTDTSLRQLAKCKVVYIILPSWPAVVHCSSTLLKFFEKKKIPKNFHTLDVALKCRVRQDTLSCSCSVNNKLWRHYKGGCVNYVQVDEKLKNSLNADATVWSSPGTCGVLMSPNRVKSLHTSGSEIS